MRGEKYLYPGAMTPLIRELLDGARDDLGSMREDPLTARETEIVKLIAESYNTKQIAETLVISEKTVDRHRTNILESLGCTTGSSWCATRSAAGSPTRPG